MKALRLPENCIWRIYTGGKLKGMWQGVEREDNHYPEDWVGSVITCNNASRPDEAGTGLSRVEGGALLRDLIAADPVGMLGEGHVARFGTDTALLVKVLDASTRLAIQAHPTRPDAQKYFLTSFFQCGIQNFCVKRSVPVRIHPCMQFHIMFMRQFNHYL